MGLIGISPIRPILVKKSNQKTMSNKFIPHTEEDIRFMLDRIGVKSIDECHEIVWRTKPRGNGEKSCYLISPRAVVRMLRQGQKFDVSITHFLDVIDKFYRKFAIGIIIAVVVEFPRK